VNAAFGLTLSVALVAAGVLWAVPSSAQDTRATDNAVKLISKVPAASPVPVGKADANGANDKGSKDAKVAKDAKPTASVPQVAVKTPAQIAADKNERDSLAYARAAQEAGFPSPAQALFFGGELGLTEQQSTAITDIAMRLKNRCTQLDPRVDAAEQTIATAFESGLADTAKWNGALHESEKVRLELRTAYLVAHADVGRVLTSTQRAAYAKLRPKAAAPVKSQIETSSITKTKP
jgi:Spy/CpxP family protein refolding chaperone